MSANQDARDNRSNQLNPNNGAYWSSRGSEADDDEDGGPRKSDNINWYWMDYSRRLREAQRLAMLRSQPLPTAVDIYE
jgi:hypothetical protein